MALPRNASESERVGLCVACRHLRRVRTDKNSVFYQCQRAKTDARYPKYPRLPVLHCPGYELSAEGEKGN
jgi:hypothetical protein